MKRFVLANMPMFDRDHEDEESEVEKKYKELEQAMGGETEVRSGTARGLRYSCLRAMLS